MIAWLVDAAAIVAQQALRDSQLRPVRADDAQDLLGGIGPHHARPRRRGDHGRPAARDQRAAIQDALERWWGPLMQMHGPRSPREKDRDLHWRIKAKTSEELRQEFLTIYVPRIRELGLVIPDPDLRLDEATGDLALHRARLGRAADGRDEPRPDVRRPGSNSGASPARTPAGCARRSWACRAAA